MKVQAKCILRAWDSNAAVMYEPGMGPLPGGLYEIDRDSKLVDLKTATGRYVFEFDRNAGPNETPHDYACKKCGKPFKTLAQLGIHSNQEHRDIHEAAKLAEPDFDAPVVVEARGNKGKPKTFTCKTCGAKLPNIYQMGVHNKLHKELAAQEVAAEPEHAPV